MKLLKAVSQITGSLLLVLLFSFSAHAGIKKVEGKVVVDGQEQSVTLRLPVEMGVIEVRWLQTMVKYDTPDGVKHKAVPGDIESFHFTYNDEEYNFFTVEGKDIRGRASTAFYRAYYRGRVSAYYYEYKMPGTSVNNGSGFTAMTGRIKGFVMLKVGGAEMGFQRITNDNVEDVSAYLQEYCPKAAEAIKTEEYAELKDFLKFCEEVCD